MTHTTNYRNTLITPAPDTRRTESSAPPPGRGTVAERQFERLAGHDYAMTSDDLLLDVHCARQGIVDADRGQARADLFSKGQPCLRSSPLTKTYGWALHFDDEERVALVAVGSARYADLLADPSVMTRAAMRSRR